MRIWVISDLHLSHIDHLHSARGLQLPDVNPDADVLVVAGDIADGNIGRSLQWLRREVPDLPIVTVLGNHDFYHADWLETVGFGAKRAAQRGIELLENRAVEIGGVRFLGATLWTDYELYVETRSTWERAEYERDRFMATARVSLPDHMEIWMNVVEDAVRRRLFGPADALELHRRSRAWLEAELAPPFAGPTVVVTHHAPHPNSIEPRFRADPVTPAFVSDLSSLIERWQPDLWIHGHTHASFDYLIGKTRVICNPHGYGVENAGGYDPGLVVEL